MPELPVGTPRFGIIGGGQLARMSQQPAIALGIQLHVLADSPGDSAALVIPATSVGAAKDAEAILRLAEQVDVITFDHEHVPQEIVRALEEKDIDLDEALSLFEEGVGHLKAARSLLEKSELEVKRVLEATNGALRTDDLDG